MWNYIGTSHKCLRNLIKKYDVNMLAISEPFMKKDAKNLFAQYFVFSNFCWNEAMGGKVWVMWSMQNGFDVVSILDQMILGWVFTDRIKVLVTSVYAKCSYYECRNLSLELEILLV